MIQELAIKTGMLGRCRYFAKSQLRWIPLLGWGLWAMNMPLVTRKWMSDQREMDRVFRGVLERKWPICKRTRSSYKTSINLSGLILRQG